MCKYRNYYICYVKEWRDLCGGVCVKNVEGVEVEVEGVWDEVD